MKAISTFLGMIAGILIVAILIGFPIMWLWNWIMPIIFGLPAITFWQAVGLKFLCGSLLYQKD